MLEVVIKVIHVKQNMLKKLFIPLFFSDFLIGNSDMKGDGKKTRRLVGVFRNRN